MADFPWEKMESESDRAFAAFITYRDLGHRRTLREAASIFYSRPDLDPKSGKARQFEKWSALNKWVQRAEEFDGWVQAQQDQTASEAIISMKTRHAAIAAAATGKIVEAINQLDATKLNGLQLLQMFDLAVKNERLARDVPSDVQIVSSDADMGPGILEVSDEALEAKLAAWRASRDPENTIEQGEPSADDEDDDPETGE
jgi:hypothetical protein